LEKKKVSRSGGSQTECEEEILVRIDLLEEVFTLTAFVLKHRNSDNPLGSLIRHCHLYFLADLRKGRATGQDRVDGAATTVGGVEFKVLNLLGHTE
jgi:hypothetical protein